MLEMVRPSRVLPVCVRQLLGGGDGLVQPIQAEGVQP
jgi:hypothetical protein